MTKRTWGILLIVLGAAAIGLAFYLQAQNNSANAVASLLGSRGSGTPAPWIVGGAGVVAIIAGFVVMAMGAPAAANEPGKRSIQMGWHDDPETPGRLRYHDGTQWTDRTAEKS